MWKKGKRLKLKKIKKKRKPNRKMIDIKMENDKI